MSVSAPMARTTTPSCCIRSRIASGVLVGAQADAVDGAVTADVIDHAVVGERPQTATEAGADALDLTDQVLAFDDRQVRQPGRADRRMTRVRVAVTEEERRVGLERGARPRRPTITPPSGW